MRLISILLLLFFASLVGGQILTNQPAVVTKVSVTPATGIVTVEAMTPYKGWSVVASPMIYASQPDYWIIKMIAKRPKDFPKDIVPTKHVIEFDPKAFKKANTKKTFDVMGKKGICIEGYKRTTTKDVPFRMKIGLEGK